MRSKLSWAGATDAGRRRLANEDAFCADPVMGLFAVCDGIGGQPSGEAASQLVAASLGHVIRRHLRPRQQIDADGFEALLATAIAELSAAMYHHAQRTAALRRMGATLAAAVIDRSTAFVLHAGDSRAYLLRDGELRRLTDDHVRHRQREPNDGGDPAEAERRHKRLLIQFVGMKAAMRADVRRVRLRRGDRLLLCTDGLTDPVTERAVTEALDREPSPPRAAQRLVDLANERGGPDNVTALVVDFAGVGPQPIDPPPAMTAAPEPASPRLISAIQAELGRLEADLAWLEAGAAACVELAPAAAVTALSQQLGQAPPESVGADPTPRPDALARWFHQRATRPNGAWRSAYRLHLRALDPLMPELCRGRVRLSPVLTAAETAAIFTRLWTDWRAAERRYLDACAGRSCQSPARLHGLVLHMLHTTRTMSGLLEFLPHFLRPHEAPELLNP